MQPTFDFCTPFDFSVSPRARKSDPESSKAAAAELGCKGILSKQRQEVLEALRSCGPSTSAELAERSGLDRYLVARRLPELRDMGFIVQGEVRDSAVGRPAVEWRLV
jgi:predicted transcriptional regulator